MPASTPDRPPSRWELAGQATRGYGEHFARLVSDGDDVDGEARLADALVRRRARILDVGSGMGRVADALRRRGHDVVAAEPDPDLRAQSLSTYPDLAVLPHAALDLDPGSQDGFDLVVVVGNVMIYVGEGTERAVLVRLRELLAPGGRLLVGFHLSAVMTGSRDYPPAEFVADAASAGLVVDQRFGTYELHPPADDYAVWILSAAAASGVR